MTAGPGPRETTGSVRARLDGRTDLGRGRSLARPAFSDDDGRADPRLRSALAGGPDVDLALLARARLLVAIVAVPDGEHGIVAIPDGEHGSAMAVVSMINAAGEKGLLAFTGIDSMQAWDRSARPVPVTGADAARAALDDGATALVIDVRGPARLAVAGDLLRALADQPGPEPFPGCG